MEETAMRGIDACRDVQCNLLQSRGIEILFRQLLNLHSSWEFFFAEEIASTRFRDLDRELVGAVESTVRLVESYGREQWIPQALLKLENRLGFVHAVEIVWRYVEIFHGQLRKMSLSMQKRRILSFLEEQGKSCKDLLQCQLEEAASKDRIELRDKVAAEISSINQSFFLGRMKKKIILDMLDIVWQKLDSDNIVTIDSKTLSLSGKVLGHSKSLVQSGTWLGHTVAVKNCGSDYIYNREAGVFQKFQPSHPNVIQVLGLSENTKTGEKVVVMEEKHCDLRKFLLDSPNLTQLQKVDFMLQIAAGMIFMHGRDVCYRDLKLENIMIDATGTELTLADFGHSKRSFDPRDSNTYPVGTVRYMAPEVLNDSNPVGYDLSVDVFSFGMAASEILSGATPTDAPLLTRFERMESLRRGERPSIPNTCPEKLRLLISQCWEFLPQNRPTFGVIYEELWKIKEELLTGSPSEAAAPRAGIQETAPSHQQQTAGIGTVTIMGDNTLGGRVTATWEYAPGTSCCVVGWGRYRDAESEEPLQSWGTSLTLGTSIDHIITPDDLDKHLGVSCLPLAVINGKFVTRQPVHFVHQAAASRDPAMERELWKFMRKEHAAFKPFVDGQRIKLNISRWDYHLCWHFGSTRNFRGPFVRGDVNVEVMGDRAMVINNTSKAKKNLMAFKSSRERDMAVLLIRHFVEASGGLEDGNRFDHLSTRSTWPPGL